MRHEGNVIPLTSAIDRRTALLAPGLPLLLLRVRDKAAVQVGNGLQALFDAADETLLERADKAEGAERKRRLQAVREVRFKRKHIELGVLDSFHEAFSRMAQGPGIGLLDEALLRARDLAQPVVDPLPETAMVERAMARDGIALEQLNARFEALLEFSLEVSQRNPLSPAWLCRSVLEVGAEHAIDPASIQVLLTLFEQHVLHRLGQCYGEANRLLVGAGVLPTLPAAAVSQPATESRPRAMPASTVVDPRYASLRAVGEAFFADLQSLLAPLRGQLTPRLSGPEHASAVAPEDLSRMLSHLQRHACAGSRELGEELQALMLKISARSGQRLCLSHDDEDAINLLGHLFAAIECDTDLHPRMRALLTRLQLPLLKVALFDKSLLTRSSHPARRLLDELAAAAIGWQADDDASDELYLRLEGVVQRLLDDCADNGADIQSHLEAFLTLSLEERRRNDLLEQRARDAEQGRLRMLHARQAVEHALNLRVQGRAVPRVVLDMLADAWSQVLLMAWLKQGESSPAWHNALRTVDDLLASVVPHAPARGRLVRQVPALLKALREGLNSVALNSSSLRDFFVQLERLHVQAYRSPGQPAASHGPLRLITVRRPIRLAEPTSQPAALSLAADDPALKSLHRLRIGSWIEVRQRATPMRCRLLARVEGSDRYVFANQAGVKVREWRRVELVEALQRGEVRLLEAGQVFERALQLALKQLRAGPLH
ncbi:hypothetical protein LK03_09560 [Pseudomonas cremoricolorata]|uniref:Thymidine phosphorylase n=2 Tax=Pseudomonas cremoricolorata TaxID=157783 RepID=A0A089YCJ4_9PSED|nr:DUF1631 family protein [Pseudomonas cremoricolorata]AIR89513.1 hypothetical protein LK03_09560 [Pseudomonas cremoricolorata]